MTSVNLKRFVDVNIKSHTASSISGTRDTVVLFTKYGTKGTTNLITSFSEASAKYKNDATTLQYLKVFFDNSGVKVLVMEGYEYSSITPDIIKSLDNKYILVAFAISDDSQTAAYTKIKSLATTRAADTKIYGIDEKILLVRATTVEESGIENLCIKYSTVVGAEMTMAAYLTKINVYKTDSVFDYMFTQEVIEEETLDDSKYEQIIANNMNVDIYLSNAIRNCGGNNSDGSDLVNTFVKIILHQTLTNRLTSVLAEKVKGTFAISKIYNAICQELNEYLNCGYLTTDKIWTDDDLNVIYNGQTYNIIESGTALPNGYIVKVLPFSSLSLSDKAERKAPPVYLIIADQYTIRQITISGEVI